MCAATGPCCRNLTLLISRCQRVDTRAHSTLSKRVSSLLGAASTLRARMASFVLCHIPVLCPNLAVVCFSFAKRKVDGFGGEYKARCDSTEVSAVICSSTTLSHRQALPPLNRRTAQDLQYQPALSSSSDLGLMYVPSCYSSKSLQHAGINDSTTLANSGCHCANSSCDDWASQELQRLLGLC